MITILKLQYQSDQVFRFHLGDVCLQVVLSPQRKTANRCLVVHCVQLGRGHFLGREDSQYWQQRQMYELSWELAVCTESGPIMKQND